MTNQECNVVMSGGKLTITLTETSFNQMHEITDFIDKLIKKKVDQQKIPVVLFNEFEVDPLVDSKDLTPLHYLAQLYNDSVARKQGYAASVRFTCTREDLRRKYLTDAVNNFKSWKEDEMKAEAERNNI